MMKESRMSGVGLRAAKFASETASIDGTRLRGVRALTLALALVAACAATAGAQSAPATRQTVAQWLAQNANAKPDFKPGDVLTAKDLERLRPFIPPVYIDQFNFPELKMPIVAARSHMPRKDYADCTEKYQAQVKLKSDGTLDNYICGQPFSNASLDPSDPQAGQKAVWNFEHRWQNYGPFDLNFMFIFDRFGGSHEGSAPNVIESPPNTWTGGAQFKSKMPTDAAKYFGGGGTFVKTLSSFYQRTYYSNLAQRAAEGGVLPVPGAKEFFWKEFEGFFEPFDVRGQVFITYRYTDPYRSDDAWAYDPQSRRVRRISVEVKSDSLVGTEQTEEDFNTFSARPVRWNFKFLGWRNLLCVMDSKYDYPHYFGPNGNRARRRMVDTPLRGGRAHAQGTAPSLQQRGHVLGHRGLASVDGADVRPPAESVQVAHLLVPLERGFRAMGRDQPRRPGDRAPGAGRDRLWQQARDDLPGLRRRLSRRRRQSRRQTIRHQQARGISSLAAQPRPLHQRMQVTTAKPCALAAA